MSALPACGCAAPEARYDIWSEQRTVGIDETAGRFGTVQLLRCKMCRQLWLHYHVEYESFSRSGRWARCPVGEEFATALKPEQATAVLDTAACHIYGGSYWGSTGRI